MKHAFWCIISVSIEGLLFCWFAVVMAGCNTTPSAAVSPKFQAAMEVLPSPIPTHLCLLSWQEITPDVSFEIDETTNLSQPFHEIATTTNLQFPFAADMPQEFFRVGAFFNP